MNRKSHIEDEDVTFGYLQGHEKQPPIPAIIVGNKTYKWDSGSWVEVPNAFAHQVFFSEKPTE